MHLVQDSASTAHLAPALLLVADLPRSKQYLTRAQLAALEIPEFQRDLCETRAYGDVRSRIERTGEIPDQLVIWSYHGTLYVLDGQHRRAASLETAHQRFKVDLVVFEGTEVEAAAEYRRRQSKIKADTTGDRWQAEAIARGSRAGIALSRDRYITCGKVKRDSAKPISIGTALRVWLSASKDVPAKATVNVVDCLESMVLETALHLKNFVAACYAAWSNPKAYAPLWVAGNLVPLCWLYQQLVVSGEMSNEQFIAGAMRLTDEHYLQFLIGKNFNNLDVHTSAVYRRMIELMEPGVRARHYKAKLPKFPKKEGA
jgi:hypothetical protein